LTALLGLDPIQRMVGMKVVDAQTGEVTRQIMTGDEIGLVTVAASLGIFVIASLLFPDRQAKTKQNAA